MNPLRTYVYLLATHAAKRCWRQGSGVAVILALTARLALVGLVVSAALMGGLFAHVLADAAGADVRDLVARHYLHAVLGLFVVTTVLPERSRLALEPYRYLPLSRYGVAGASATFGALRIPLLFFLAHAGGLSLSGAFPHSLSWFAATAWLGIAASLFGATLHNELRRRPTRFFALAGGASTIVLVDLGLEAELITSVSAAWSASLFDGAGWTVALALLAAAAAFFTAARTQVVAMQSPEPARAANRHASFLSMARKPVLRLALAELQMLRRCSYPRYQLRAITLLVGVIVSMMLFTPDEAYRLVTTLFAVAGIAISYAQLAFAWNGDHFDGIFALPFTAEAHVQARWLVGAVLTSVPAVALLAIVVVTGVASPVALVACYLLTLGWLIAPLVAMSMRWSQRVSLDGTTVGNLKAYSWHLYVVAFGLWAGSHLLITLTTPQTTTLAFIGLGVVGVLIQPAILRRIAANLDACLPELAERMRLKV